MSLDEVERLARIANRRTASFGVAFRGCTLPGAREPLFVVPEGQMAIGLGIHGEPGVAEEPIVSARALARILVERLVRERPQDASGRVAVVLNGLGATKYEELFGLWAGVQEEIEARGLTIVAPEVGEFVTSFDMAGCSLTVAWLDYGLEEFWLAPAEAAAFRRGAEIHATARAPIEPSEEALAIPAATGPSQEFGALHRRAHECHRGDDERRGRGAWPHRRARGRRRPRSSDGPRLGRGG